MPKQDFFSKESKFVVFLLRLGLGILIFYAGITKVLTPNWSATTFLQQVSYGPFKEFFLIFANSSVVDFLVMWGLTLIGVALILGAFTRLASFFGILLMLLFYFTRFPPQAPSWFVDEHIMYGLVFLLLIFTDSSSYLGLKKSLLKTKFVKRNAWVVKYI